MERNFNVSELLLFSLMSKFILIDIRLIHVAMDKFNYFCKLAKINYPQEVEFAMERTALYNEMTAYFPYNEINPSNQSGFVQVSMYFEVDRLQVVDL